MNYLPQTPNVAFAPVVVQSVSPRSAADGRPGVFLVDTLFPATLTGRADLSSVDEGTAAFLYGVVRMVRPRVVLETGTHKGRSTRELARGLRDNAEWCVTSSCTITVQTNHLYTVDLYDYGLQENGALLPGTEGYVTQIVGETPGVYMEEPLGSLKGIDFAFLDGDHTADGLEQDVLYVMAHRAKECWVAVDNSRDPGWPDVSQVLRQTKWSRVSFGSCTGLDVLWLHG